jgi:hypothetical protein
VTVHIFNGKNINGLDEPQKSGKPWFMFLLAYNISDILRQHQSFYNNNCDET